MVVQVFAVVMVEHGRANEGNAIVLAQQGGQRRLKPLQAYEARSGTVGRVSEGPWKSDFAGMRGTIQELWVSAAPAGAAEVLLENGSLRLFWVRDLVVVDEDIVD